MALRDHRRIVIGIGNSDRGDDAAGRAVARWLHGRLPPEVEILKHSGEATSLLESWDGVASAYLVDACVSDVSAGTVRRFDAGAAPLPRAAFGVSSHGMGLAEAIELARALGRLPPRCILYAIEGESFEPGDPLSSAVAAAIAEVGRRLQGEIREQATGEGRGIA